MNQLPEIEVLESEEFWSQRAIDTPEEVLEELKRLKQQQPDPDVNQQSTASALPIPKNKYNEKESPHEHIKTNARPVASPACQQAV